jgi:subtilisin family serine protease
MYRKQFAIALFLFCSFYFSTAQSSVPQGWHLLDPAKDSFYGINLNNAYQFLKEKNKKSKQVIVAVLDGGIDTAHEDLKDILWHNPKEIAGNGKDDDGNGLTDDVLGWNFLGNKDGSDLKKASDERSRVYHRFKNKFFTSFDSAKLNENERYQYEIWKKAANEINMSSDEQMEIHFLELTTKALKKHDKVLREDLGLQEFTCEKLESLEPKTKLGKEAKFGYLSCMKMIGADPSEKNTTTISELDEYVSGKKEAMNAKDTPPHDYRAEFVGDDYNNINDKFYGNNDVMGPDAKHGTHVAGIIAAKRNNGIGIDGVADNVKIMTLRVVPDGDEYDKDIALGIFYAVDNGAKVINMSFGKSFSPEKRWVDSAVRYAELKDVLIVHAAGNDAADIDVKENYPSATYLFSKSNPSNFITVGASSDPKLRGNSIIADFSNYGKESVDVFAPGVKIYSTMPGKNEYGNLQGTSMAAPIVTGLAALIRSYFPDLTAQQVKQAIEGSVYKPDSTVKIIKPGSKNEVVPFTDLCRTGGIIDAHGAILLASTMKPVNAPKQNEKLPKSTFKPAKTN